MSGNLVTAAVVWEAAMEEKEVERWQTFLALHSTIRTCSKTSVTPTVPSKIPSFWTHHMAQVANMSHFLHLPKILQIYTRRKILVSFPKTMPIIFLPPNKPLQLLVWIVRFSQTSIILATCNKQVIIFALEVIQFFQQKERCLLFSKQTNKLAAIVVVQCNSQI